LSPRFSDFAYPAMQIEINEYYKVTWELTSAYGDAAAKVKLNKNVDSNLNDIDLKFPNDELEDGGRYSFKLTIKDIKYKQ
jgi:hypothetical protein